VWQCVCGSVSVCGSVCVAVCGCVCGSVCGVVCVRCGSGTKW
jgi:hypothetical protein